MSTVINIPSHRKNEFPKVQANYNESFIDLCTPYLKLILQIRAGFIQPTQQLREQVEEMIAIIGVEAYRRRFLEEHTEAVKFMLSAYTDEMVLLQNFELKESWEQQPIQLRLFGENKAGRSIYSKVEDIYLRQIDYWGPVLELYYMCFLMGFEGECKLIEPERRIRVMEQLKDALYRLNRLREGSLSPHGLQTDQPPKPTIQPKINLKKLLVYSTVVTGSFAALVYFSLLIMQKFNLNRLAEELLH